MKLRWERADRNGSIFRDEDGFTTTSMVISLLITLALVFTAAQVYRINSISAEVQDVADAAALSAETQVAEFMIVAKLCDAVVMSMTLTQVTVTIINVVMACIPTPFTKAAVPVLKNASKSIAKARKEFSKRASMALEKLQEALPFLAAACAASVAFANNADSDGSLYIGLAMLAPLEGESIQIDENEEADELTDKADEESDEISEEAERAERASLEAEKAKREAFEHDCGNNPGRCMYERAEHLIGLSGRSNPLYRSVDTWSFSVALERAKAYYSERRYVDEPASDSDDDYVNWRLRTTFYDYAYKTISSQGYVRETMSSFDANFPRLPRNAEDIRRTSLYTQNVYPITEEASSGGEGGGKEQILHAWMGCPGAKGSLVTMGSLSYMESASLKTCPVCKMSTEQLGRVASLTSTVDTGFEYHYAAVADAADEYKKQRVRADGEKESVKQKVSDLLDGFEDALKEAGESRIEVSPPGRYGVIALVVNCGSTSTAGGFASGFVNAGSSLGPRAALSSATLIRESSDDGVTILNSLLDGLREKGGVLVGAAGIVLDIWSGMLQVYSNGINGLINGIESVLNSIPLASASGLGTWAADSIRERLEKVGLQPANFDSLKPVLVNSVHVAAKDEDTGLKSLVVVKQQVVAHPLFSGDLFSSMLTEAERTALGKVEGLGDKLDIASIELLSDAGVSIPLTIPLPGQIKEFGVSAIQDAFDRLRSLYYEFVEVRVWE